jgi:predicted DNA-binding ribbon-helix-helix protein
MRKKFWIKIEPAVRIASNRTGPDRIVLSLEKSDRLPSFDFFIMPKSPTKRSIVLRGRKTSISLEEPFWVALQKIASERRWTISDAVAFISEQQESRNLSSAIRVFVLNYFFNAMNASNDNQNATTQSPGK